MSNARIPPTLVQRRLVHIGMLIQFHLAAIGYLTVWLWTLEDLLPFGIPFSFGILVTVYILFRLLLAYARFGVALVSMISISGLHAILMGFLGFAMPLFFIVPVRLAIPILLYSAAYYHYRRYYTNLLRENEREPKPENYAT